MPLNPMAVCHCKEMKTLTLGAADQDAILIGLTRVSYEYSLPGSGGVTNTGERLTLGFALDSFVPADLLQLTCRLCLRRVVPVIEILDEIRFALAVLLGGLGLAVSRMIVGNLGVGGRSPDSTFQPKESLLANSLYLTLFRA